MIKNEFIHNNQNLKDINNHIIILQDNLSQERKAKEFSQQSNNELKQKELDLIKKEGILQQEKFILDNKLDDSNKRNQSLTETLSKLNKNIMDLRLCNEKLNNENII